MLCHCHRTHLYKTDIQRSDPHNAVLRLCYAVAGHKNGRIHHGYNGKYSKAPLPLHLKLLPEWGLILMIRLTVPPASRQVLRLSTLVLHARVLLWIPRLCGRRHQPSFPSLMPPTPKTRTTIREQSSQYSLHEARFSSPWF